MPNQAYKYNKRDDNEWIDRLNDARMCDDAVFYGDIHEKLRHAGAVVDLLRSTKESTPMEGTIKQTADLLCAQIYDAIKDLEDWYEQAPGAGLRDGIDSAEADAGLPVH